MTNLPALDNADHRSLGLIKNHLAEQDPGTVLGLYLYGSTVTGERGPESDLDLLLITRTSLSDDEREALTRLLLELSGWSGHREAYPEVAARRPIELTSVAVGDEHPAAPCTGHDYQYGEWLRPALHSGAIPQPQDEPDTLMILTTAQAAHQRLQGAALNALIAPVPHETLRSAALAAIPALLDEMPGDERNALLTLARIAVTSRSGLIVSKRRAAELTAARLIPASAEILRLASAEHLGEAQVDWAGRQEAVLQVAQELVDLAHRADCARQ